MLWRRRIEPFARPFFQAYSRISRGMTLGVRGVALDAEGRVLLVEHTYIHGWHLPGGGVEHGETCEQAMIKEMVEEAGVAIVGRPRLLSIHDNSHHYPGDHVLVYRIDTWRQVEPTQRGEIARIGFFTPDDLPEGATRATRDRIKEALQGADVDPFW
jgi:ADP-ribose pyrophosphatase YjhB (NUDIX family)